MRVGICQFDITTAQPELNHKQVEQLLAGYDFDLVVLPELFDIGSIWVNGLSYSTFAEPIKKGYSATFLHKMATTKKALFVAGVCEGENGKIYSSMGLWSTAGLLGKKQKNHFSIAEAATFNPGGQPYVITCQGIKIGLLVCSDCEHAENWDILTSAGCRLVCVSANVCGHDLIERIGKEAGDRKMFVIFSNAIGSPWAVGDKIRYVGHSAVFNDDGQILLQAGEDAVAQFVDIPLTMGC